MIYVHTEINSLKYQPNINIDVVLAIGLINSTGIEFIFDSEDTNVCCGYTG